MEHFIHYLSSIESLKIFYLSFFLLVMPGPTNILILSSGLKKNWKKLQKIITIVMLGYLISVSILGFTLAFIYLYIPWITVLLKILSAIYIAFLSIKVWKSSLTTSCSDEITLKDIFITTLLSPKAFVLASYIIPSHAFELPIIYFSSMIILLSILYPISCLWALLGKTLHFSHTQNSYIQPNYFFKIASLTLMAFSISLLYSSNLEYISK
ncbi:LysE family transporter [Photorhabdus sp. APURE]|uniref:LysE family translocator n=1 Tax=Photorhabdus aballayi TaxID=2991723 RepID=UPI00223D37C8|nr:LysE family transporter [Photorhabdus aballayi]MCW7548123.1 LysE family transporter [Photorhabdus aballayi]